MNWVRKKSLSAIKSISELTWQLQSKYLVSSQSLSTLENQLVVGTFGEIWDHTAFHLV